MEVCDDIDNDCDSKVDEGCDDDGDDWCDASIDFVGASQACPNGKGDCNDGAAAVHPGAKEACNDSDEDCDGQVDEGCDDDGDGFCDGNMAAYGLPKACTAGAGDCNDGDGAIHPGPAEILCDDVDNNCDGKVDEGCDDDGDEWCDDTMTLVGKAKVCPLGGGDCNDAINTVRPGVVEICDDMDNDCNGKVDEGCDGDGDGYCTNKKVVIGQPKVCSKGVGDCGDGDAKIHPGAAEACDDVDNDCDQFVDEGCDDDGDDWCDSNLAVVGKPKTCTKGGGDCQDTINAVHPGVVELCDDVDNDCDGKVDLGCDGDGDGWCAKGKLVIGQPKVCSNGVGDCDDKDKKVFPGAPDTYGDQKDQDCDGGDGAIGGAPVVVTVTVGGKPAPDVPVVALLMPGEVPTGNLAVTKASGKATFPLMKGLSYRFHAVVGDVSAKSKTVTAPGQVLIALPAIASFKVRLQSAGAPLVGLSLAVLRHQVDPVTGIQADVPLNVSKVTGAGGLAPFALGASPGGFRFQTTVNGFAFTSKVFLPKPDEVLVFDVGPFANIKLQLVSGANKGHVGGMVVQAYRHQVDTFTGQKTDVFILTKATAKADGTVVFVLPSSPTGYRFKVPDLFGYTFWSELVKPSVKKFQFLLPGFVRVAVSVSSAGVPLGGVKVQALNHRERLGGSEKADDVWKTGFTTLKTGTVEFVLADNATWGQPTGGWTGKGYIFRLPDLLGYGFVTGKPYLAKAYTYPPGKDAVSFQIPGFAQTKVIMKHGNTPIVGVKVRAWRVRKATLTGKTVGDQLAEGITNGKGEVSFLLSDIKANMPEGFTPLGMVWQAPDVDGWNFVSHAQVANLWCDSCPADAGGAIKPHYYVPKVGYPPVQQTDTFAIVGMAKVTVRLRSGKTVIPGVTVRGYRVRQNTLSGTRTADLWQNGTTDNKGDVAFTLPDPAIYSKVTGWTGKGFVWRAPNIHDLGFISHAQVSNLWCSTCPPEAGGATKPHFFVPKTSYPPHVTNDAFDIVGLAKVTVQLTSAGTPVPVQELRAYRLREHILFKKTHGDHWQTRTTDKDGKATFVLADPAIYNKAKDWLGKGFVWHAPSVAQSATLMSYSRITNIWCTDCPPDAAGALNPHVFAPKLGYPPKVQSDAFKAIGFAKVTVRLTSGGKPVPVQELRAYRLRKHNLANKTHGDHWRTGVTDKDGKTTFVLPDPKVYSKTKDWTAKGFFWYAPSVAQTNTLMSWSQVTNIWCTDCPPEAAGALNPHISVLKYGYPPTPQNDEFKGVGFTEVTVKLHSKGKPTKALAQEVRVYRIRKHNLSNKTHGDHWRTGNTDKEGKVTFKLPDPLVYSKTKDWTALGYFWYVPNFNGWGHTFLSWARVTNIWCTTCPAGAAGALNPSIYKGPLSFPPAKDTAIFNMAGFVHLKVSTSGSNNGSNMRLYRRTNKGTNQHVGTQPIKNGKVEWRFPDYKVYSASNEVHGVGWRFYREKGGHWSGVVSTPFGWPPVVKTYSH